ncbi:exoglucanase 3 precursor [Phlyctema vagabunda]|uniref:Glucanase n=1 Tax=Phlyctema vagabunda TaxID=108571 RepID=A0ABR4P963_9HELO
MLLTSFLAALSIPLLISASPTSLIYRKRDATDTNPYLGKTHYVGADYAGKLDQTVSAFLARNDTVNAARTRTVQQTSTFIWITTRAGLVNISSTISEARAAQSKTNQTQIVQLVLYNLPDRDCSAGASAGELTLAEDGLNIYKKEFVDVYAALLANATDLTFSVILEPDSLGNVVTNMNVPLCQTAAPGYEEGIAYAIAKLQLPNVALYIDAAHGGWLGWNDNLPLAAAEFGKVVKLAQEIKAGAKIRGFATDVSNFNPYSTDSPANYTEGSQAPDELSYATILSPFLTENSLPTNFIIDQGRSGLQGSRASWSEWCNVPAGYGIRPTTETGSDLVDSIVWVKPAGESDGPCGPLINGESAPEAGRWWEAYAEQAVINANPVLTETYL